MRYSIDIDDEIIKKIDYDAERESRTRKTQMEHIIKLHYAKLRIV